MSEQRKYSIDEIDAMRESVRQIYRLHSNFDEGTLEARLRTFMMNGTDPAELAEKAQSKRREVVRSGQRDIEYKPLSIQEYGSWSI